ncbi:MAG: hypothetical protein H7Y39_04200 [Nitrospiraceae bacterium]|nr:hypothetical protein [Nitrospiraceae bacterium]
MDTSAFEHRVCDGETDTGLLDWVCAHMRSRSIEDVAQWDQVHRDKRSSATYAQ